MEIVPYERAHLEAVIELAVRTEFSPALVADSERAHRAMSAPNAVALIALEEGEPLGFSHTITDGAFQAYLCMLLVAPEARRRGVARALVEETLGLAGAIRLDLISTEGAEDFYRSLRHGGRWPGYRLYPPGQPEFPPKEG